MDPVETMTDKSQGQHRLIPIDRRAQWEAELQEIPHAFAHTWGSCHAMQLTTGMPTFLYCFAHDGVEIRCPIAERRFAGRVDVVTPYGFSGFTGLGIDRDFPAAWRAFAAEQGWICGHIGLHPLLARATDFDPADAVARSTVFVLDLRPSETELFARLSVNRRRQWIDWERRGRPVCLERDRLLDFLLREHERFFRTRRASRTYYFSRETWVELFALPSVLALGALVDGELTAVTLFGSATSFGDYLFTISNEKGTRWSAPLLWHGALELRQRGVQYLNLGGGIRPDDGVARFKRRFGGEAKTFQVLNQVYDQSAFARLCDEAGVDPHGPYGYFPPYRAA